MASKTIPNDELRLADVPAGGAEWSVIQDFALTYDGYGESGSFERCAAIAQARRHDSLDDLRTCLFFEQRSWRHQGEEPAGEAMAYVWSLVEKIRAHVVSCARASTPGIERSDGLRLRPVRYRDLNARQKENYNFLKVSAVLADYGYMTMRLSDDWQGADFIAQHVDGSTFLKVQLKARAAFGKKYQDKELYVAFFSEEGDWYLYPHDELLGRVLAVTGVGDTASWTERGGYSFAGLTQQLRELLAPYKIGRVDTGVD